MENIGTRAAVFFFFFSINETNHRPLNLDRAEFERLLQALPLSARNTQYKCPLHTIFVYIQSRRDEVYAFVRRRVYSTSRESTTEAKGT